MFWSACFALQRILKSCHTVLTFLVLIVNSLKKIHTYIKKAHFQIMPLTFSGGFGIIQTRTVDTSTQQVLFTVNFVFVHPCESSFLTKQQVKIYHFCTLLPSWFTFCETMVHQISKQQNKISYSFAKQLSILCLQLKGQIMKEDQPNNEWITSLDWTEAAWSTQSETMLVTHYISENHQYTATHEIYD